MSSSSSFWDNWAERYSKKPVADEASYQTKLRQTREYFKPDMEVLEIGCGTGSTALAHAPFVKHIRATDISKDMLAIAHKKATAANINNVTFEQSSVETLEATNESIDMVMAHSILHLLENKEAAIAKIHTTLKPGGVFVSSTACLGDTMKFFKYIGPVGKFFGLIPLVKVFTVNELVTSLTSGGFVIDHQWQPGKGKSVFIVAKKPAE